MKIRRINIFGGPGCGKSTASAFVFSNLKSGGYEVELVDEHVKSWAYENRKINSFDQSYLFARQMRKEFLVLNNSNNCIITDSPIIMSVCYAMRYGFKKWGCLQEIATEFESEYPSINIFLKRENCKYEQEGRYENFEEAVFMDETIIDYLSKINLDVHAFKFDDHKNIIDFVKGKI